VLFVDDSALMRRVLPRMLSLVLPNVPVRVAADAHEALRLIEERPPALVISDLHMQPVDGVALLTQVQSRWPAIVRVVITGDDVEGALPKVASVAHAILPKPFEPDELLRFVRRALDLAATTQHPRISELIGSAQQLPAAPRTYQALLFVLTNDRAGIPEAAEVVARDPAIAAEVLRVASSPFYCRAQAPTDLNAAAARIGLSALEALVLGLEAHRSFPLGTNQVFDVEVSRRRSLLVAHLARRFCRADGSRRPADQAFLAGLLHQVGALALASRAPEAYGAARALVADGWPEADAETCALGVTQAQVGAHVLGLWGLPADVVDAVRLQDSETLATEPVARALGTAIVVARRAQEEHIEESWLEMLGLRPNMPEWHELLAPAA